jgi:tungstate transport system substrate-binding protein
MLASIVLVGGVMALICALIIARSLHSITIARLPAESFVSEPGATHEPFVAEPSAAFRNAPTGPSIRVAVIGGMTFTGVWDALAKRYQQQHGVRLDLIVTGEKNDITHVFKQGGVDLITMHACDMIINLVADGYAMDPQPWMRNDLIIVGPPEDPAGIKGMTDAAAALSKIAAARSPFVVHKSLGSQEVLMNILAPNQIILDPAHTTVMFDDMQRSVLMLAGQLHAYTLVGRIPFRSGKLPNNGLVLMVRGDPRLRRPYLIAVANPARVPGARVVEARRFAAYVREPATQAWIAEFGRGKLDDGPLFFPVVVSTDPATRDATTLPR